jgi:hypothetical protein
MSENTSGAPTESAAPAESSSTAEPPSSSVFEVLSPAEQAYLESGGEKTDGLFSAPEAKAPTAEDKTSITPDSTPVVADGSTTPPPEAEASGDVEPGEVIVGEDGKVRDGKGRFVPLAALRQERTQRQALAEQLQLARQERETAAAENARLAERLSILQEALSAPDAAAPPAEVDPIDSDVPIDPEVDIFGAFKQMQKRLEKSQTAALAEVQKAQEGNRSTQAQIAEQQLQKAYQDDALHFSQETPDFGDAWRHLGLARAQELRLLGVSDEADIKRRLIEEERLIVIHAVKTGQRPSKLVYDLAKAKGYTVKEAKAAAKAAEEAAPPAKEVKNGAAMGAVETLAKAQRNAGATLSGGSGSPGETVMTAESLANMSERDFDAMVTKLGADKINRILGQ